MAVEVMCVDPAVKQAFLNVRRRVLAKYDGLPHIKVAYCWIADRDHEKRKRQYAHWGHIKNTICVARAIDNLPDDNKRGIFLHEFGHVLDDYFDPETNAEERMADRIDSIEDDEDRADEFVARLIKAKIEYDDDDVQREVDE